MRYYFHQRKVEGAICDDEGSEHPNLASAREEAIDSAREILATAVRMGRDIADRSFEIADEDDRVLETVPFSTVLAGSR